MGNRVGVKAELPDCSPCFAVVDSGGSSREKEFRFALGAVSFHRNENSGANQDAIVFLLGGDDAAFFDTKAFAQLRRYNDRAPPADFRRFHNPLSECLIICFA